MKRTPSENKTWFNLVSKIALFQKNKKLCLNFLEQKEKMKDKNKLGSCIEFILH